MNGIDQKMNKITALFLLGMFIAGSASAQTAKNDGLVGLDTFNLKIEELSEDGEKCLLKPDDFSNNITNKLLLNGIKITEGNFPTLYVQVNTVAAKELCFSSVNVNINYFAQVPHPKNPLGTLGQIVLWNDYYLVSSEKEAHQEYVQAQITMAVDGLVRDWQKLNQPVAIAP